MATNNFKPFATAANANVTAQADWESLPALLSGFTAGKASSAQVNKAIRQASFIAAALAQYTANKSGLDVLDDGDLNGFIAKMSAAFGKDFQALDATLTALAGLKTGANKLPYFTGTDTASQTDLTSVGRDIIGKGTIADILTYLGFCFIRLSKVPELSIKRDFSQAKSLIISNILLSALGGTMWYLQFFFYAWGHASIPAKYDYMSWMLHMSFYVLCGGLVGLILREWNNAGRRPVGVLSVGCVVIIIAANIVGLGMAS